MRDAFGYGKVLRIGREFVSFVDGSKNVKVFNMDLIRLARVQEAAMGCSKDMPRVQYDTCTEMSRWWASPTGKATRII